MNTSPDVCRIVELEAREAGLRVEHDILSAAQRLNPGYFAPRAEVVFNQFIVAHDERCNAEEQLRHART